MRKLLPLLIVLLLAVLFSAMRFAQNGALEWEKEVLGQGIKPALSIDGDDNVHAAFMIEDFEGNVTYATNASGEWVTTIVSEGYFYGPLDIEATEDGQPIIAYHDHQGLRFDPQLGDAVIATLQNDTWNLLTVSHPGHDGWDNSLALDADGNWHTVGVDPAQFGSQDGVEYATNAFNEGDAFVVENVPGGPVNYEFATAVDVAPDGTIGVTYFDMNGGQDLVYAERSAGTEGAWEMEKVDTEGDVGRYADIRFDADGNPHLTYFFRGEGRAGTVRYAWRDADGAWTIEDVGELMSVQNGMAPGTARKITSIDFDSGGNVYIAYSDNLQVIFAERSADGTWSGQVVADAQDDQALLGALVELKMDSQDNPHLIYYLVRNQRPLDADVVYATATR